jgi:glucose-1-phosphate thymidylyltransferase
METTIKEILIIFTAEGLPLFRKLLGSGEQLGLAIHYKSQEKPRGIAAVLILGEEFISG